MRKLISGRTYNTDTAKKIVEWEGETLYVKTNGEHFLCSSAGITPLSPTMVKVWAKNLPQAYKDKIFYVPDGMVATTVKISGASLRKLKDTAAERKTSISALLDEIIADL